MDILAPKKEPRYWAAKEDPADLAKELWRRKTVYYDYLRKTGRYKIIRALHNAYYRGFIDEGNVVEAGEQGEILQLAANHLRNLGQHTIVMTTAKRVAFEPKSTNTDVSSQEQAILAKGLLEYKQREKRLERGWTQALEYAWTQGEGWRVPSWNASIGKPYGVDPNTGRVKKTGDVDIATYGVFDMVRDPTRSSGEEPSWLMPRRWVNKYELAAKYPELEDQILQIQVTANDPQNPRLVETADQESDEIPLFEFRHAQSDALPSGRYALCAGVDVVLEVGPLPYERLHIYRLSASDHLGTCFGYTIAFDLLPVQTIVNGLYSTVTSNQNAFGVQNLLCYTGSNISVGAVTGGLRLVTVSSPQMKPEPLNLLQTRPETFQFLEMTEHLMETLSGVNSVARGDPEAGLKNASGSALALIQAQALQFNSGLQESYIHMVEDEGTAIVEIYKAYATVPTTLSIVGKAEKPLLIEGFTGDKIKDIERVTVDVGTALSQTEAGRLQMAQDLLNSGLLKDRQEYFQVLESGKLDPMLEGPRAEMLNIRSENERLADGQPVTVLVTDNHPKHILDHKVGLDSPEARENPAIAKAYLDHMQGHINVWRQADPILLQSLNIPPFPAPPPVMGPPGMGPPGPGGPPPPGGPPGAPPPPAVDPAAMEGAGPKQPSMPTNPLTGQPAEVPGAMQ